MVHESGSCSQAELLHSNKHLLLFLKQGTELSQHAFTVQQQRYEELTKNVRTFLPCLKEMVSTPRRLESTCRLVISRCLTVRRRRERAVRQLTLPSRTEKGELLDFVPLKEDMKNYLLFSDLADPKYGSTCTTLPL
jgi:hypothetical protein